MNIAALPLKRNTSPEGTHISSVTAPLLYSLHLTPPHIYHWSIVLLLLKLDSCSNPFCEHGHLWTPSSRFWKNLTARRPLPSPRSLVVAIVEGSSGEVLLDDLPWCCSRSPILGNSQERLTEMLLTVTCCRKFSKKSDRHGVHGHLSREIFKES